MRILQVNKFFYVKGGPERYMFTLSELLRSKGHTVAFFSMEHAKNTQSEWNRYFIRNVDYEKKMGISEKIGIFLNTLYSKEAEHNIGKLLDVFKPDIAHLHNFNHQLTPSIIVALKKRKIPVVATVHDYKFVCPSYAMLNHGLVCQRCEGKRFYQCLITRCHKNSLTKSLLAALESYLYHNILHTYNYISAFIFPSRFIMNKSREMGLRGEFVNIPNFVDVHAFKPSYDSTDNTVVYWGRLSYEKGVRTLMRAAQGLSGTIEIIGDGLLKEELEREKEKSHINNAHFLGYLSGEQLFDRIRQSHFSIIPSECNENNPISALESFALGKPVVGAKIGGIPELVREGETGLLFESGNVRDLHIKIEELLNNPALVSQMGKRAREIVENEYNSEVHYNKLLETYKNAVAGRK